MLDHLKETDYGTPRRESEQEVTLEIDGNQVTVPKGTSLMRAAVDSGVQIPKLCATDSLEPFGSCRLCLVEIEGRKGFPASCTTPAEPGMKVRTQTPKLQELRLLLPRPCQCQAWPVPGEGAGSDHGRRVAAGSIARHHRQERRRPSAARGQRLLRAGQRGHLVHGLAALGAGG